MSDPCALAAMFDLSAWPAGWLWAAVAGAVALLAGGGNWAVGGAARLASALGISKVIVGATVVSLGTTSAELFVSVLAAVGGQGDLALGNAVGSIIADTALIFGLGCVLARLPKDRFVLHRQGVVKLACVGLLTVVLAALAAVHGGLDGVQIPRVVGFLFVALLAVYMLLSVRWARQHPEFATADAEVVGRTDKPARRPRGRAALVNLAVLAGGLALVIAGSKLMIGSVTELSLRYHVPRDVLAVTVVAFGTSLPELVTAIAALAKGHPELMVGNVIGADILNVLFVVGVSASAVPLDVPATFFWMHLPVMLVSTILLGLYIFVGRGKTFHRWQGVPLLAIYAAYIALLVATRGRL